MKNPHIVDRPLTDQDLFSGREAAYKQLRTWLEAGQRLLLVFGRPGIGVTSFLNRLDLQLPSSQRAVRRDLPQWSATPDEPLWLLLTELADTVQAEPPDRGAFEREGDSYARAWVQANSPAEPGTLTVVCLDAMPIVVLEHDARWAQALLTLRDALEVGGALALVLAVRGLPDNLEAVLPKMPALVLGALSEDESDELLTTASRGVMAYDYDAVRLIHQLCGGEPFFEQLFGQILYEQRAQIGWVGLPEVRNAVDAVVEHGAARFEQTWNGCVVRERVVLCAFAEMMGFHGVATAEDIAAHLRGLRVPMGTDEISEALQVLTLQGMVDELGGRVYRTSSELLRLWVGRNHSVLDTVRQSRRYRQLREEPSGGLREKRIDWVSILLWAVGAALVVAIAWVWRSREREVLVLGSRSPTVERLGSAVDAPTRVLPTPASGVAPGNIVYMARPNEAEPWAIYRMRSDGSDPTRLTQTTSEETLPVWSPDGRMIAFVSNRDGNREIYTMHADGSNQVNLTRNAADDWTPCWSPSGQKIAFASYRDGNWEIYTMNADGTEPRRLTNSPSAEYSPAWSPDGRTIACVSAVDGNLEIYAVAVENGQMTRLTFDGATDQAPAWSPDGKLLAWESYRDGNMEIYIGEADGSNARNQSRDSFADDHGVTFSPWGGSIAYYSNRHGGWDIYTLNLDTGERVNLTASEAQEQAPNWGP